MALKRRYTHKQLAAWLQSHTIGGAAQGGFIGNGMKMGYSVSSPVSYKKFEQLLEGTPGSVDPTKIDVTVHGSGGFMANITGLNAVADTTMKLLRDHSAATSPNQNALFALLLAKTTVWLLIEIPDGPDLSVALYDSYEYQVKVNKHAEVTPINGRQELDISFLFCGTTYTKYPPRASVLG